MIGLFLTWLTVSCLTLAFCVTIFLGIGGYDHE